MALNLLVPCVPKVKICGAKLCGSAIFGRKKIWNILQKSTLYRLIDTGCFLS